MKWRPAIYLFALFLFCITIGCKKTEDLDPLPQNEITAYKITNLQDTVIYGAIDHFSHTITVYIPYYYGLNVIDPEISVSPGAQIVEEILPVPVNSTSTRYTVKAADGSTNVYTLSIVQQNTPSLLVEWEQVPPLAYPLGEMPFIRGNFMTTNRALANVQLIHERTGNTIDINGQNGSIFINPSDNFYTLGGIRLPANTDTGAYQVKISFLGHHRTLEVPLQVSHRQPDFLAASRSVKQSENISFRSFNSVFLQPTKAVIIVNGDEHTIPIANHSLEEITLTIPADFPTGAYNATYSISFQGWLSVTRYGSLTVQPK